MVKALGNTHDLTLAQRQAARSEPSVVQLDLSEPCDFSFVMRDVDVVIHTAALVHQMNASKAPSTHDYYNVNTEATERLAVAASEAGVKHFIFLSSIKVHGEGRSEPLIFERHDRLYPEGDYAKSKAKAEFALLDLSRKCDMQSDPSLTK